MAYKPVTAPMIRSLANGLLKSAEKLLEVCFQMEKSNVKDIDIHWTTAANLYGPKMRKFCQDVSNNVVRQVEDRQEGRKTAEQVSKEIVAKRKKKKAGGK